MNYSQGLPPASDTHTHTPIRLTDMLEKVGQSFAQRETVVPGINMPKHYL